MSIFFVEIFYNKKEFYFVSLPSYKILRFFSRKTINLSSFFPRKKSLELRDFFQDYALLQFIYQGILQAISTFEPVNWYPSFFPSELVTKREIHSDCPYNKVV